MNQIDDILKLSKASEVISKDKTFLVESWIPDDSITVIAGNGGIGKSSLAMSIVASLSRGENPLILGESMNKPFNHRKGKIMIFNAEDSMEYVLKKKLDLLQADTENILFIDVDDKNEQLKDVYYNSKLLLNTIKKYHPMLVVFDPLHSFLPPKVDMNNKVLMNNVFKDLKALISKTHTTVILSAHTNKMQNVSGRARLNGTSDIWDSARSVIFCGEIRDMDYLENPIYISHEKSNYSELQKTVIAEKKKGIPVYYGRSDKKDRDFQLGLNISGNESVASKCATYIVEYFKDENIMEIPDSELKEIVINLGCFSERAYRDGKSLLKEQKKITLIQSSDKITKTKSFIVKLTCQ